jgi:hypothetical protein
MMSRRFQEAEILWIKEEGCKLFSQRKQWREIGNTLGISHEAARKYVLEAMRERSAPVVEEARNRDLELIDQTIDRLWKIVDNSQSNDFSAKNNAAATICRLIDQRAKLLGMHAPQQIEQTITQISPEEKAMQEELAIIKARAALKSKEHVNE